MSIFLDSMQTDEQPTDYKRVAHSLARKNTRMYRHLQRVLAEMRKFRRIARNQGKEVKRLRREININLSPEFCIFKSGDVTYALETKTQKIRFYGINSSWVIQQCLYLRESGS